MSNIHTVFHLFLKEFGKPATAVNIKQIVICYYLVMTTKSWSSHFNSLSLRSFSASSCVVNSMNIDPLNLRSLFVRNLMKIV